MKKHLLAFFGLVVLGVQSASAQIPAAVYQNLGKPAYSCYEEVPTERWWIGAEYLVWWMRGQPVYAPLLTTGTTGIPGDADTGILFPTGDILRQSYGGMRGSIGSWFNCERTFGLEVSGFFFERRTEYWTFESGGEPGMFIPINDVNSGTASVIALGSSAAGRAGNAFVTAATQLWGYEGNVLFNWGRECGVEADLYFGIRYLDLTETLNMGYGFNDSLLGTSGAMSDRFDTRNQFYGAQVGAKLGWYPDRLSLELIGKFAFGNMHEVVEISGQNSGFNTTGNTVGGVFAQPSNIGRHTNDDFGYLGQGQFKVNFELFPNVYVGAGYDILFVSRVVRPGLQIDPSVALNQPGGTALGSTAPGVLISETDFWAHGLSITLQYKY